MKLQSLERSIAYACSTSGLVVSENMDLVAPPPCACASPAKVSLVCSSSRSRAPCVSSLRLNWLVSKLLSRYFIKYDAPELIERSITAKSRRVLERLSGLARLLPFTKSSALSNTDVDEEVFKCLSEKCESSNDAILSLIKDVDHFVDDAISSDGRGHFMSTYDGCENEEEINKNTYYIYRTN